MDTKGINIIDEVDIDGMAVSALLFYNMKESDKTIKNLTREEKILFLKYAAKEVPEHFGFYNEKKFNDELATISDTELSEMVEEVDWLWK